eukprot:44558-Karenia_brevis.AAC.1
MNGDLLLYQLYMQKNVEEQLEEGPLEEATKNLRESKGLPYYALDEDGNRSRKQYKGEAVQGMLTEEEREQAAIKGLETQSQIARFLNSKTRAAWLVNGLVTGETDGRTP